MKPELPDALGRGQAAVLASIIRRAGVGPARITDIARDTGLRTSTVRQHVAALDARDLVHPHVDARHVTPLVRPLSLEQAAASAKERTL